jgi:hypothetical protein
MVAILMLLSYGERSIAQDYLREYFIDNRIHAQCNGSSTDSDTFENAINSGLSRIELNGRVGSRCRLNRTLYIPSGVEVSVAPGVILTPVFDGPVIRLHAGASFVGTIDTTQVRFTSVAIDIDGDDNATPVPFRLHTKTMFDAVLIGSVGQGTGTAVRFHADGQAAARIMGVEGRIRVYGFETGLHFFRASKDLSQFINSNKVEGYFSNTIQSLKMESGHPLGYGIDGNTLSIRHQPVRGTIRPAIHIAGQGNDLNLVVYDWDAVAASSPHSIVIQEASRRNVIRIHGDPKHLLNRSTDDDNIIINPANDHGISLGAISSIRRDRLVKLNDSEIQLDTNRFVKSRLSSGAIRNLIGNSTNDETLLFGARGIRQRLANSDVWVVDLAAGNRSNAKRLQGAQGATIYPMHGRLILGSDGNYFRVASGGEIHSVSDADWQGGAEVTLYFEAKTTLKNNRVDSLPFRPLLLASSFDAAMPAGGTMKLVYDNVAKAFVELARSVVRP